MQTKRNELQPSGKIELFLMRLNGKARQGPTRLYSTFGTTRTRVQTMWNKNVITFEQEYDYMKEITLIEMAQRGHTRLSFSLSHWTQKRWSKNVPFHELSDEHEKPKNKNRKKNVIEYSKQRIAFHLQKSECKR